MKRANKLSSIAAFLILIMLSTLCHSEVIDKILVVVNDEVITQGEVDLKMIPIYERYKTIYDESELGERIQDVYKQVLEQLINDKLVISEARRKGLEATEEEIKKEIDNVKSRFESEEQFYMILDRQGISLEELKANYKSSLMARKLVWTEIGSRISVTPIELIDYYNTHQEEFATPPRAKVCSILIKIKKERGSEESLKLANEILERLKGGEDFAKLASSHSDDLYASSGGDMGYVKKEEMIKRIDDVLFSLKDGEYSDIIRTDLGFHIYKVEGRLPSELKSFQEVKEQIEKNIFENKVQEKLKTYLDKLRENAYIAFK